MNYIDLLKECGEVAGLLWEKGWAERNGGNMVYNISEYADSKLRSLPALAGPFKLDIELPHLANALLYCKGSGKRMRDLAKQPMENGCIIRIQEDGKNYSIVACKPIMPTSELSAHLRIHDYLLAQNSTYRATLHTHPTLLVALSHRDELLIGDTMTRLLWSMIPEARLFCQRGIGMVPYLEPGTAELADASLMQIANHDLLLWEKHGTLSIGDRMTDCFDLVDVMEKAAAILIASGKMSSSTIELQQEHTNTEQNTI